MLPCMLCHAGLCIRKRRRALQSPVSAVCGIDMSPQTAVEPWQQLKAVAEAAFHAADYTAAVQGYGEALQRLESAASGDHDQDMDSAKLLSNRSAWLISFGSTGRGGACAAGALVLRLVLRRRSSLPVQVHGAPATGEVD